MVKNVDNAVYAYIDSVKKNTPFTGIKLFDLKANGVSLATTGGKIDDIQDKLKAAGDAITSGATTIPTAPTS